MVWNEEDIPLIHTIIPDIDFLKRKNLTIIFHMIKNIEEKDNEILLGYLIIVIFYVFFRTNMLKFI